MKPVILTIDDHRDTRRLIRMTLEFKDFVALEAEHGRQGLAMARTHQPALILLDRMMPGMSGLSVAEALRVDPQLARIPIIMLSAMAAGDDIEAGLRAGARAYLVKPFSPLALIERVHEMLELAAAERG